MTSRGSRAAVLFGGTSQIGQALIRELVAPGTSSCVVLAGRPSERRAAAAAGLRSDYVVSELDWDARQLRDPVTVMDESAARCNGPLDLVVLAAGTLPTAVPDFVDRSSAAELRDALLVNSVAPSSMLVAAVRHLAHLGGGRIVVLSSAAAVRPRAQILTYSLAKQSLDAMARQLQASARKLGVDVHVVRPGHVHTQLTRGLPVPPLARSSEAVARDVSIGIARGRRVIWSPRAMPLVMGALRCVPPALLPARLR